MPGLLIDGRLVDVPGVDVIAPGEQPWATLSPRDYQRRPTTWIQMIVLHTTKGKWPQHFKPGAGAPGKGKAVADFWRGDPVHSAAQLVVDRDGTIACLCDLVRHEAYHATTSNPYSVGIEMYQESDGGIYEATLRSAVQLVLTLCDVLGIPLQIPAAYHGRIIERLLHGGGHDVVGVIGHRDQAWMFPEWMSDDAARAKYPHGYASRGRGDPGDEIFARLRAAGAMPVDFDAREDLAYWRPVQRALGLEDDGVCGPKTAAALRRAGLWSGGVFLEQPIA